jgi:hypothetical protein
MEKGEDSKRKETRNGSCMMYVSLCVRRFIKANTHQCPLNDFFYYLVGLLASSESRIWNFAQSINMVICRLIFGDIPDVCMYFMLDKWII